MNSMGLLAEEQLQDLDQGSIELEDLDLIEKPNLESFELIVPNLAEGLANLELGRAELPYWGEVELKVEA